MAEEEERTENALSAEEEAKRQQLAFKIVDLAKALVLADNHFLSAAVGRLNIVPGSSGEQFATDGYDLCFEVGNVLDTFKETKAAPKHDLLHSVVHCLFLHPYVGPTVNQPLWDLACDIAAERAVADLVGVRDGARGVRTSAILGRVERDLGCRATAEKVYKRLSEGMWLSEISEWSSILRSDDHTAWYCFGDNGGGEGEEEQENGQGSSESQQSQNSQSNSSDSNDGSSQSESGNPGDQENTSESQGESRPDNSEQDSDFASSGNGNESDSPQKTPSKEERRNKQGEESGNESELVESVSSGLGFKRGIRPDLQQQQEEWRQVATSLAVNLQTISARHGSKMSGFVDELELAAQQKESYRDFLRQFAVMGESMRISDDEFDTIFYTYGMKLYGNLPLIEPLEFREEKLVKEFVIVIDTSGSVQGDIVQGFIETTFDILKSTESFFERVNIRLIQCDAAVQSDDKITSLDELKEWGRTMKVLGCGGTDFRPAFDYVDKLIEDGEFENLGGLVYFTDGRGTYPEHMPAYKTAFAFYDEDYRRDEVPPWAVQIVLDADAIAESR